VILELVLERVLPGRASTEFCQCDNGRKAARGSNGLAG
jgi:hypothetical protein